VINLAGVLKENLKVQALMSERSEIINALNFVI